MDKIKRMEYLVEQLNIASDAYYGGRMEYMSNYEWDKMFDELMTLENETGIFVPNSPTQVISRSQSDDVESAVGKKESHEYPALSLEKTKEIKELQKWAAEKKIWLSWKLDGLTLVLTYDKGKLTKILTRGNGITGTNITYMKDSIEGFPTKINYEGHLVVRGEAVIFYSDFEKINAFSNEDKYANPRNLASGTLALDPSNVGIVKERHLKFIAFSLVYLDDEMISWGMRMNFLDDLGFYTVERIETFANDLPQIVNNWSKKVEERQIDVPVDGLVICYDDTEFAATGSVTGHHATRAGLAFKWQDKVAITTLNNIEWSCAASVITPVAIFDPVQLEGTRVSRASLCNISELERLGIGANGHTKLKIIKANKIIPKCVGVLESEGEYVIPKECPVCHAEAVVSTSLDGTTKTLHCINIECPAKKLHLFARFVSRQGVNIEGLSIKTLMLLINNGLITDFASIFLLSDYYENIRRLPGFGDKSCKNLINAIEQSKHVQPINFIYSLGIPLIGLDAAKKIIGNLGFNGFLERVYQEEEFIDIAGIGNEKSSAIKMWFKNQKNRLSFDLLIKILEIKDISFPANKEYKCKGLVFVITGEVYIFENRTKLIEYIEKQGGEIGRAHV